MPIVLWLILGGFVGWVTSKILERRGDNAVLDALLGIGGAVAAGVLVHVVGLGGRDTPAELVWSLFAAALGAVLVLAAYHVLLRGGQHRFI